MPQKWRKGPGKKGRADPIRSSSLDVLITLSVFFANIEKDYRICPIHIGIFAALLQYSATKGFVNPIEAFSHEIMPIAKISGSNTYHKHLKELSAYGYLHYQPSFKNNRASRIYFLSD